MGGISTALVFGEIGLVRSLGEAGIKVIAAGTDAYRAAYASRYVDEAMVFPSYASPAFVEKLLQVGRKFKEKPVLLTDNDKPILAFSRHRKDLSEFYRFLLPDEALIEDLVDKRRFSLLAERHPLPVPRTFLPATVEDLKEIADRIAYPCILKPAHQDIWKNDAIVNRLFKGRYKKAIRFNDPAALVALYEQLHPISPEMIVQEFVEGRDEQLYDVHAYLNEHSEVLACFVGRKLRTSPIHFGMGCYTVGVIDKEIETVALAALRRIGYKGIAAMNLKRDPRNGAIKILEINPRCSLWNYLASRSGVNIPALACADSIGQSWKIQNPHRVGLHWWNMKEDLKSMMEYRRVGEWTMGRWVRSLLDKKVCHVFSWRDPAPALYSFLEFMRSRLKHFIKINRM
ncbi:MAG: hypothetical protein HY282_00610 [Nitrospirae bacterium]|nr:hypothetical protein [Candidatus Manganitrophaceae bacterium]